MSQPSLMQHAGSAGISKPTTLVSLAIHAGLVGLAVVLSASAISEEVADRVEVTFYTPPPEPEGGSPAPAVVAAEPEPEVQRRPPPRRRPPPDPEQFVEPDEDADEGDSDSEQAAEATDAPTGPITAVGGTGNGMGHGTGNGVGDGRGSAPPEPVFLPQGMQPPRKIAGAELRLTPQAQRAGVTGLMMVRIHIGADGSVRGVNIMRGHPLMNDEIQRVLRTWRFTPPVHRGQRIPIYVVQRIRFQRET